MMASASFPKQPPTRAPHNPTDRDGKMIPRADMIPTDCGHKTAALRPVNAVPMWHGKITETNYCY